jgi:hypothetical protein
MREAIATRLTSRKARYVGSRTQSDVVFPLTPALSLREREEARQRVRETGVPGIVGQLAWVLPLPEGEGWGEGEQAARPSKPLGITERHSILSVFICVYLWLTGFASFKSS